jgi:1-acyl-sn-glycerol-3-phosphate acyltransferase
MGTFRAASILTAFFALTVPLMPVQAFLLRVWPRAARRFPHWYHRQVCRLIGVRLAIEGAVAKDKPVLLIANHTSWLDIPVLSAVAPLSFIAKKDVTRWPFVSTLAWLQRSVFVAKREVASWPLIGNAAKVQKVVFVDRMRRQQTPETNKEIAQRLAEGHPVVLFAEGTSSDGNRVLPFRSALIGAVETACAEAGLGEVALQPMSICYTAQQGLPMARNDQPVVAWYGDLDFFPHFADFIRRGVVTVNVSFGDAVTCTADHDRKLLAKELETAVREMTANALRHRAAPAGIS